MDIKKLKEICIKDKVPILRDDSIEVICKMINELKITTMLEIGSGYGYSGLFLLLNSNVENIISLEKNIDNFYYLNQIEKQYEKKIHFINVDAFEYFDKFKYDLIFIDGPKSKQIILFEKYKENLNNNGIIIIDNIFMNNLRNQNTLRSKKIIDKVEIFKNYLLSLKDWNVQLLNVGDGLAVCKKKQNYL